jgi:hypothetical protein
MKAIETKTYYSDKHYIRIQYPPRLHDKSRLLDNQLRLGVGQRMRFCEGKVGEGRLSVLSARARCIDPSQE